MAVMLAVPVCHVAVVLAVVLAAVAVVVVVTGVVAVVVSAALAADEDSGGSDGGGGAQPRARAGTGTVRVMQKCEELPATCSAAPPTAVTPGHRHLRAKHGHLAA